MSVERHGLLVYSDEDLCILVKLIDLGALLEVLLWAKCLRLIPEQHLLDLKMIVDHSRKRTETVTRQNHKRVGKSVMFRFKLACTDADAYLKGQRKVNELILQTYMCTRIPTALSGL